MKQNQKIRNNIWIIMGLLGVILICFMLNTFLFQRTLYKTVAQDLYYNSHNVADQISTHIKSKTDSMADLADALARMPEQVITKELLYRKAEAFDMDLVSVFHKGDTGVSYMGDGAELADFVEKEWENLKKPEITLLASDTLVFTAPVFADGELWKVVAGKKSIPIFLLLILKMPWWVWPIWKRGRCWSVSGGQGPLLEMKERRSFWIRH